MKTLNLDILITTPKDLLVKDINNIFIILLSEIQNYLGLAPINPNVTINISIDQKEYSEDFFNLGVSRTLLNNQTQIDISDKYLKFLEFILLREAYLNFIPYELREREIIQIVIHEIIESDLFKLEVIDEWKTLVRSNIINYEFLSAQFDKMNKFFKLEATENTQSPTQFFFEFIYRNISLIHDKMDDFYDILYEEFIYKTSKSLYNDEIVETIRILIKIFDQVKLFKKYIEFEDYFQKFKEEGLFSTDLSKRKFSENLRWINKYTIISPSFHVDFHKLDIALLISILKFHPILNQNDISNIIDKIPFLHNPVFVRNGFSTEVFNLVVIPRIYLKDLEKLIEKLKMHGYITNTDCYIWLEYNNFINLNYFREYLKGLNKIINPNHKDYDNRLELKFTSYYGKPQRLIRLNLLDWVIFERARQTSLTGFGFEQRVETLQSIKDELLNYIESERLLISNLKSSLNIFYEDPKLRKELLDFLETNQKFGFFYIEDTLQQTLVYLDLIENVIRQYPEINNLNKLQEFMKRHKISQSIEENLYLKNKDIQKIVFRDFFHHYFRNFEKFTVLKQKYYYFFNFFSSCKKLKIFNLDSMKEIVNNEEFPEKIYYTKEKKLKASFEKFKPYKITNQKLDSIFKRFIETDLIIPGLIKTIITSTFAKYHPILLLKDTLNVNIQLEKIIRFFPRVLLDRVRNSFNNDSYIILFIYFLNIKEKEMLTSILYNIFNKDLISFKRYFTSGLVPFVLIKDFYDFDKGEFFYTRDLFEQIFLYIQNLLGESFESLPVLKFTSQDKFWSKESNIFNLIKAVDNRISYEQPDFNLNRLNELRTLNENLTVSLLNTEKFKDLKQAPFFKTYIKSIKFIPNFQAFKLNQFFLYIHPSNVDEIDFKHLLINTFQSIKYPTNIDHTNSFLIKYIFPHGNPNMKHLNWYTKTKRIIKEYCLFFIKRVYQILNFNHNLKPNGWNYDSNHFKIYMQNILFNQLYQRESIKLNQFNIDPSSIPDQFNPYSFYFQALTEIYSWKSLDIKSFLGTQKYLMVKNFSELLKKNLIFPYISIKNLGFQDKIYIILPNVKAGLNQTIINIFNFFNYGFIYEIAGEFYIYGFNKEIKFENGLMIKLYFPQCELDEFLKLFNLLFEYLEIKYYIILTDLVNGMNLLKEIYGSLKFLDTYNPLINLKWNNKDKIWMNHKIFTKKFEKIYPDLLYRSAEGF
ncbi:MAG: hypothetical protein ACFFA4_01775 [Promethearchaeota archaeon]